MPDANHHARTIARLRAALTAAQSTIDAMKAATAAHLAANPDPTPPPPPAPEE